MPVLSVIRKLRETMQEHRRHGGWRLRPAIIVVGREVYCSMRELVHYDSSKGLCLILDGAFPVPALDGVRIVVSVDVPDDYAEVFSALSTGK